MGFETGKTKKCPFCAETIQVEAVKCRHCAEFLFDSRNSKPKQPPEPEIGDDDTEYDDVYPFCTGPSILAGLGTFLRCLLTVVLAIVILKVPIEDYLSGLEMGSGHLTENQLIMTGFYRKVAAVSLIVLAVAMYLYRLLVLKSINYQISPERIEWSRGIFSRKIDNLDMFRVVDLKLHRSLMDCMLGIGTVTLMTKDETDPEFIFYKIPNPRSLYDLLKEATLSADRKQGVIHLE